MTICRAMLIKYLILRNIKAESSERVLSLSDLSVDSLRNKASLYNGALRA